MSFTRQLSGLVLGRFGRRKAALLAVLSGWLPAILLLRIFGWHPELPGSGSVGMARTLLAVYLATLICSEGGAVLEIACRSDGAERLSWSQANAAILGNFILVIAMVLLLPVLTLFVSGTPNGMIQFMLHQYLRDFPRSAYYGMQGIFVGGTALPVAVIFRLNVAPLLLINLLSLFRRKAEPGRLVD